MNLSIQSGPFAGLVWFNAGQAGEPANLAGEAEVLLLKLVI